MPPESLAAAEGTRRVPPPDDGSDFLRGRFREFSDRAGEFVRSLRTVADFAPPSGTDTAEPNLKVVRAVFGKWSIDILVLLYSVRRAGFGEIRRLLPGISSRVLSAKLKILEDRGLLERTVIPSRPPRAEYSLTPRGLTVTRLGEPVLLFLRVGEGLYRRLPGSADPLATGPPRVDGTRLLRRSPVDRPPPVDR